MPIDDERADQFIVFEHRNCDIGPHTPKLNSSYNRRNPLLRVGRHRRQVSDVDDLPCFCKDAKAAARRRIYHRLLLKILGKRTRRVVKRYAAEAFPLTLPKHPKICVAKPYSIFKHSNKHGLKITR